MNYTGEMMEINIWGSKEGCKKINLIGNMSHIKGGGVIFWAEGDGGQSLGPVLP